MGATAGALASSTAAAPAAQGTQAPASSKATSPAPGGESKTWWRSEARYAPCTDINDVAVQARAQSHRRPDVRWRQPGARSGGTTDADRLHDVMAAISMEVIADRRHGRVMPHRGTAWLQEEWKQSLSMMGELRDNEPPGERSRRGQLIKTLPDEVLEHYPDLRDKNASDDAKFLGLWNLLKKHQGEVYLTVSAAARNEGS